MKKRWIIAALFLATSVRAQPIEGWDIQITHPRTVSSAFQNTEEVETYTGDFMLVVTEQKAKAGHVFVTEQLSVAQKTADGLPPNKPFNPENIVLDINGQFFSRIAEDEFLYDYKMKPLTHLKIKLGTHEGSVVFEIPDSLKNEKMILRYDNHFLTEK